MREQPELLDYRIASLCRVGKATVSRARKELAAAEEKTRRAAAG